MYSYSTRPFANVTQYTPNNDQLNYFSSTTTKFLGFENKKSPQVIPCSILYF